MTNPSDPQTGPLSANPLNRERRLFWILFLCGLVWAGYRAVAATGWILDDELTHYLISRGVLKDPESVLAIWARPGRNIIHVLPAQFGLTFARLFTLSLAAFTVWLVGREARALKMANWWLVALLMWFQCWFPELSFAVLTQTPFLIVWFVGVYLARRGRLATAALFWGYLGLVRHEGIAMTGLWALWVAFAPGGTGRLLLQRRWDELPAALKRDAWIGFCTALPMLVFNVVSAVWVGKWPFMVYLEPKPTDYYGHSSTPLYYLPLLIMGAGIPVTLLALIGLLPSRRIPWSLLIYISYPAYFVMHSVIYWLGLYASGGYYHFLMPMAPFMALMALRGVNGLKGWTSRRLKPRAGRMAAGGMLALVVWFGLMLPQQQLLVRDIITMGMPEDYPILRPVAPPIKPSRFDLIVDEAIVEMRRHHQPGMPWIAHHVLARYRLQDRGDDRIPISQSGPTMNNAPHKLLFLWDASYSAQDPNWDREVLDASEDWELLGSFGDGRAKLYQRK